MSHDPLRPYTLPPYRSPKAVSEALREIIRDRVVCDLGCAEGDNLVFLSRYAKRAFGMEQMPRRYDVAMKRGLDVIVGDYRRDPIPDADVYYCWLDNASQDDEALVARILACKPEFEGTIIVAGDPQCGAHPEETIVRRLAEQGTLIEVPFDEGPGFRQHGLFLLAVLDASDLRRRRS